MKPPLCKCGCGKLVTRNQQTRRWNKYVHGHNCWGRSFSQASRDKSRNSQKGRVNAGKHNSPNTEFKKGQHPSPTTELKKGNTLHKGHFRSKSAKPPQIIECHCPQCKKKMILTLTRFKLHNKHFCSYDCRGKFYSGARNYRWRGGITAKNLKIRYSKPGIQWANQVLRRDNFTCAICKQCGGKLHSHHIMQFAYFPEERFNVRNGVTLCEKCHKKWHSRKMSRSELLFALDSFKNSITKEDKD